MAFVVTQLMNVSGPIWSLRSCDPRWSHQGINSGYTMFTHSWIMWQHSWN